MAIEKNSIEFMAEQANLEGTYDAVEKALEEIGSRTKRIDSEVREQQKAGSKGLAQLIALKKALSLSEAEAEKHKKMLEETYFGRFDFLVDGEEEQKSYYIGYFGFNEADETGYRTLSWKAPISEIFYRDRSRIEDLETTLEGDTISGETLGKRRYLVDGRQLLSCEDIISGKAIIDSIAAEDPDGERPVDVEDGILMQILSQDTEAKLKDIIRSIQAEQDKIIRLPLNRTLVVQGVAGSGKSTVGLHRIAYLLYNYRKALSEEAVLVLVPNPQFIDYIQDLLPMLETEQVKQHTFESLLLEILDLGRRWQCVHLDQLPEYRGEVDILEAYFEKGNDAYIELTAAFIKSLYQMILKKIEPLKVEGTGFAIKASAQRELICTDVPFNKNVKQLQDFIRSKLRVYLMEQKEGPLASLSLSALAAYESRLKEAVETYVSRFVPLDLMKVYQHFLNTKEETVSKYGLSQFEVHSAVTKSLLAHGMVERKDLAVLFQLKLGIEGRDGMNRYRHIFVDEAQDYSPQEFLAIRNLSENHSMTFMGDIHQGIYRHRGLKGWETVMAGVLGDLKPELYQLRDSYRSTCEIVTYANQYIDEDLMKAKPVLRRGDEVKEIRGSEVQVFESLNGFIQTSKEQHFRTLAVVCEEACGAKQVYERLKELALPYALNLITEDGDHFTDGVSVITVDRAKGLEFDSVFVLDASAHHYPLENPIAKRRLYVALSRAKHMLWVSFIQ